MPSAVENSRKSHLLTELLETEQIYVDQLTGIVRKVASAWSRSNLPPPELDVMFRCVETIFKANRSFLTQLKNINTNAPDPKVLGDLLMTWVDELNGPYTIYCAKYVSGFDDWPLVQTNSRLTTILKSFSSSHPPASSFTSDMCRSTWTLDLLFIIPRIRIKYYHKLYNKLLKIAIRGGSADKLLTAATEKLDYLDAELETKVANTSSLYSEFTQILPTVISDDQHLNDKFQNSCQPTLFFARDSSGSSLDSNRTLIRLQSSDVAGQTSLIGTSVSTLLPTVVDLDKRLLKDRMVDLFTMKLRPMHLVLSQPSLPFERNVRFSIDVIVSFTSNTTGQKFLHNKGHIFLLTDLLLVCEKLPSEDRDIHGSNVPDMSLCYPPLVGKYLQVDIDEDTDNAICVEIMKKERLILICETSTARDSLFLEFQKFTILAATLPTTSKSCSYSNIDESILISRPMLSERNLLPTNTPTSDSNILLREYNGVTKFKADNASHISNKNAMTLTNPQAVISDIPLSYADTRVPHLRTTPSRGASLNQFGTFSDHDVHEPRNIHPSQSQVSLFSLGQIIVPSPGDFTTSRNSDNLSSIPTTVSSHSKPSLTMDHATFENTVFAPPPNQEQSVSTPLRKSSFHSMKSIEHTQGLFASASSNLTISHPYLPSVLVDSPSAISDAEFDMHSYPLAENTHGPVISVISSATIKCKVFLQQQHAQWKSLGAAKLTLYERQPINEKQLVVEADNKEKSVILSTMVLSDGVERVGKTGVAIEISDQGARTGTVFMIQLRNEISADGLYNSLLTGSDRARSKF